MAVQNDIIVGFGQEGVIGTMQFQGSGIVGGALSV